MILSSTFPNVNSDVHQAERLAPQATRQQRGTSDAAGAGGGLGILTKFADTQAAHFTSPDEDGEVFKQVERSSDGELRIEYDADSVDLERWILRQSAGRLLWNLEERQKRSRVCYSEVAAYSDLLSRRVRYALVCERYFIEDVPGQQKKAATYRVVNCCRSTIKSGVLPELWQSLRTRRVSLHRVSVCGSVWTCPICSRRINLARQRQLKAAYSAFIDTAPLCSLIGSRDEVRWADAVMITFTLKHGVGDDLSGLFDRMKLADRSQQKMYCYKRLVGYRRVARKKKILVPSEVGYVGRVSAAEVTLGKHGWHPHLHQLWFFDRRLTVLELERLRADLFSCWSSASQSAGLPAPLEFFVGADGKRHAVGVDVCRALSAAEYIAKFGVDRVRHWGVEKELAGSHVKSAGKGDSPFQLLYKYSQGDSAAGQRFSVYAESTLGRHQLEFSKGLRARLVELGVDGIDASEEDLATALEDDASRLGELADADFQALCNADRCDVGVEAFGTMLLICKYGGFDSAVGWLRSLPSFRGGGQAENELAVANEHLCRQLSLKFWSLVFSIGDRSLTKNLEDESAALVHEFRWSVRHAALERLVDKVEYLARVYGPPGEWWLKSRGVS